MRDFNSLMKLGRKLAKKGFPDEKGEKIKIAVLGSSSIQHFVLFLRANLYECGIQADIYEGEYNGINMDVYDEASPMYDFAPDYVLLLTHYLDLKVYPALLSTKDEVKDFADGAMSYYQNLWKTLHKNLPQVRILQSNFVIPPEHLLGNLERQVVYSRSSFLNMLNNLLVEQKPESVTIVDLDLLSCYKGKDNWFDYSGYFLSKSGFRLDYLPEATGAYADIIRLQQGKVRKCLVLDLDNTIWGGTVGDLGWDGIMLDPNEATGEAYRYFQQYVLALKERGVILAVCSKNEEHIAKEAFEKNTHMILHMDDIACFVANWQDKASNIRHIANELNIGLDSLVFFDDNPAEREIVHNFLPEVEVIDVPEDPALYVTALDKNSPFQWLELTKEDVSRSNSYIENRKRTAMSNQFVDYDSYLQALEMCGNVTVVGEKEVPRFTQLLNKSNQFNLRTERYTEGEISAMLDNPQYSLLAFELKDKFSDYGIISCVILEWQDKQCFIRSWVMSCRVLKRGVEYMMFDRIYQLAGDKKVAQIKGEYLPTKKNVLVKDFLDDLGFDLDYANEAGEKYYHWDIAKQPMQKYFIKEIN